MILDSNLPNRNLRVYFTSPPQTVADILCASSQTIKSHSETLSFSCIASFLASLSKRQMHKSTSLNTLPVAADSILSLVRISKCKWNFWNNSSCHCSTRLPGETIRHRLREPRAISSLMNRPVIIVLPAPGSSARTYRSGRRGSIS